MYTKAIKSVVVTATRHPPSIPTRINSTLKPFTYRYQNSPLNSYQRRPLATQSNSTSTNSQANPPAKSPTTTNDTGTTAYVHSEPSEFLSGISSLINASRTSTTKILWQMRAQERADMDSHLAIRTTSHSPITPIEARSAQSDPTSNTPTPTTTTAPQKLKPTNPFSPILPFDSFWSVSLPFDTDLSLFDDYVRFDGGVRFERILEDLDAFAGNVAHLHIKKGIQRLAEQSEDGKIPVTLPDMSIVTASVDGITMNPKHRFPMDKHLALQGCVTWVGSSSMEIWIEMRIVRDPAGWSRLSLSEKMSRSSLDQEDVILNAFFMMAARDQKTGKATFVPPLDVAHMNSSDRARFERGDASATRRKVEAANSLTRNPPTAEEIKLIHHYIMDPDGVYSSSSSTASTSSLINPSNLEISAAPITAPPGAVIIRPKTVSMADTEMNSATMTQPQDRNTNGKIFGGYLMKNAYELARCNAYIFCGANSHPYFIAVDSMSFLKPVEIGSIISFGSKICYSGGHPDPAFQIRVETLVHDLVRGTVYPSNVFHFTFQCDKVPVRKIQPHTYREAVDYLDGKRRREKLAKKFKEYGEFANGNKIATTTKSSPTAAEPPKLIKEKGPEFVDSTPATNK